MIEYKNTFGSLTLTPVTCYLPISEISFNKCPQASQNAISFDDAERIALITDNNDIQIAFDSLKKEKPAYVILHHSTNIGRICRVDIKSFQTQGNIPACEQIQKMTNKTPLYCLC